MKIVFNNNKGELNLNTNEVTFGNITFTPLKVSDGHLSVFLYSLPKLSLFILV